MTTPRSAGHAVVEQLERHGVERVYCVPGESYLDVLDGLYDSRISTIVCRQEGGAGFMAIADSRLTKQVGVALVTRGPGAANAAIAVHTAWQDATAMVLFVGLVPVGDRGRESFQEFDLAGWFGTTAKKVLILDSAERAVEITAEALHLAASGRPGPVVVGLPEDVLVEPTSAAALDPRPVTPGAVGPDEAARLTALLSEARRPLVVVGGDRWTDESAAGLDTWARGWRLPVLADWRAQDVVDNASPSFAGWLGFGRSRDAAHLLDEADLVCFVGCGNADVLSDGYQRGAPDRRTVVVDPDAALSTHHGSVHRHLLASPEAFVTGVRDRLPETEPTWTDWWSAARSAQERFATPLPDEPSVGVDLGVAMAQLRQRLDEDAVVTYGAGNHALWPQRYLTHGSYPSLLACRNGAMGFGVPAAVAAAITRPGRQVVSVAGDGCFLMNGQELSTAVQYGASPVVLVFDNAMYGTIRRHQEHHYPGRVSGTALHNPDFAAYARSFGAFGATVKTTEDFGPALDDALASGRAAVLHLVVDPDVAGPTRPRPAAPSTVEP